jgi:hypothetical protein
MLDRIHDLYDELERHRVMLSFKGNLTPDLVNALLDAVEHRMNRIESDQRVRKKVFNVVMECLQNLFHHNSQVLKGTPAVTSEKGEPHGVVMIVHLEKGYSIVTGNFMAGGDVERLKSHLDRINAMDAGELREFYRSTLADGEFSPKGGGGLGMIDIARKSGGKLEYGFVPYDEDNSFFSLNVNVSTRPETT